jgi:hypothetical protein
MNPPGLVAHCDWSIDPKKRWMAVGVRDREDWHLAPPEPVGDTDTLFDRLVLRSRDRRVLAGFDFPIGLPAAYGERTDLSDFPSALRRFGSGPWAAWFDVCERPEEICPHRPFYPYRPGGTSRHYLFDGLRLDKSKLLRACDRATTTRPQACMLFWTLGGNQVGKAAISGWRDVIVPSLDSIGLWPFQGSLSGLIDRHRIVVAETYPAEAYTHVGIAHRPVRKKVQEARRNCAGPLLGIISKRGHVPQQPLCELIADGFGADASGEDRFDSMVGLLAMLDVVVGHRSEGTPDRPSIKTWEGWILGQAAS